MRLKLLAREERAGLSDLLRGAVQVKGDVGLAACVGRRAVQIQPALVDRHADGALIAQDIPACTADGAGRGIVVCQIFGLFGVAVNRLNQRVADALAVVGQNGEILEYRVVEVRRSIQADRHPRDRFGLPSVHRAEQRHDDVIHRARPGSDAAQSPGNDHRDMGLLPAVRHRHRLEGCAQIQRGLPRWQAVGHERAVLGEIEVELLRCIREQVTLRRGRLHDIVERVGGKAPAVVFAGNLRHSAIVRGVRRDGGRGILRRVHAEGHAGEQVAELLVQRVNGELVMCVFVGKDQAEAVRLVIGVDQELVRLLRDGHAVAL